MTSRTPDHRSTAEGAASERTRGGRAADDSARPAHAGHEDLPCELIWERNGLAIASNPAGQELRVGGSDGWEADRLLSLALQAALMSSFLEKTEQAGVRVLGYMSSGALRLERADDRDRKLVLAPCVIVESELEREMAWSKLHEVVAESPVCRLLGDGLVLAPHIVTTSPGAR